MTKKRTTRTADKELLSSKVLSGEVHPTDPDSQEMTVQSLGKQLTGVRSLWHSKLVVPEQITIAGEPVTLTQAYRFDIGESKAIGADLDATDAMMLIEMTARTGGCCGSAYQTLRVFEGIFDE